MNSKLLRLFSSRGRALILYKFESSVSTGTSYLVQNFGSKVKLTSFMLKMITSRNHGVFKKKLFSEWNDTLKQNVNNEKESLYQTDGRKWSL